MDLRSFCHSAGQPVHTQGSHLPVPSDAAALYLDPLQQWRELAAYVGDYNVEIV
jgi:hypothetical protein